MVFVDPLTIMLVAVAASTYLIALYLYRVAKGRRDFDDIAIASFFTGLFDFISGFLISFTWPFPGNLSAYNMLFGDPMLFLGIIMLAGSVMLYRKINPKVVSIPAFILGVYLLVETYAIPALGLEPGAYFIPAFSLYLFATLSAIFSPVVYLDPKKNAYAYYFVAALLIITALIAIFIGCGGIYEHLASPP